MQNKKSLGQHWLKDRLILDNIADLAAESVEPKTTCLEIGPGLGTLTSSLLKRFSQVIAVEFDPKLAENLPKSFPGTNLTVVNTDILKYDLTNMPQPYVVAGNIPYYITSPIITKLLAATPRPQRIVLLIQQEVAERILAGPGRHTVLSLTVQNCAQVEPGFVVSRDYFTPPPKVDSAVIVLKPHAPLVSEEVMQLVKQGFASPRKKLSKNLPYGQDQLEPIFTKLGIDLNARPADLALETWQQLADELKKR